MFNRSRLLKNISNNIDNILDSEFLNFIKADIIDRLVSLEHKSPRVLAIRDHENFIVDRICEQFGVIEIETIADEEEIGNLDGKFDLVIFPFGLHMTNNVQEFLGQAADKLSENGIFVCNFAGGGSLNSLRQSFFQLEDKYSRPHSPHIIPMIRFDHVASLLSQAGFTENVVDMEKFELEFDTPVKAMRAIKDVGQGNVLDAHPGYSITKEMYIDLSKKETEKFVDNINLVTFIASKNKNTIKLPDFDG